MSTAASRPVALLLLGALAVAGCGGSGGHTARSQPSARSQPPAAAVPPGAISLPDPAPTGRAPAAADVRVIRGWADTLRHGDVRGAAAFFAVPSEMINGPAADGTVSVVQIHSLSEAVQANVSLPCGARFVSADQRGEYVNALFTLTSRPGLGGDCQGTSGTGRVNFVIRAGHIVRWIRAPDQPGDGTPSPAAPAQPPAPGQPTTTGPLTSPSVA